MPIPHYLVDINGNKIPLRGNDNIKAPLPPELRELPGEFVTTDIADGNRVHRPPHRGAQTAPNAAASPPAPV